MGIEERIGNSDLVTTIFGRWPSFHDAEVLRIILDRRSDGLDYCPMLQAAIHVFEMTSQVNDQGFYILKNHVIAHFRFLGIIDLKLVDFNQQNVLQTLIITDLSDRQLEQINFQVELAGIFGVDASFQCRSISVEAVEPYALTT